MMACFKWYFDPLSPLQLKKTLSLLSWTLSDKTFWIRACQELLAKCNVGLKTFLYQGISEPVFYGDLVYKFKSIDRKHSFPGQRTFDSPLLVLHVF